MIRSVPDSMRSLPDRCAGWPAMTTDLLFDTQSGYKFEALDAGLLLETTLQLYRELHRSMGLI